MEIETKLKRHLKGMCEQHGPLTLVEKQYVARHLKCVLVAIGDLIEEALLQKST